MLDGSNKGQVNYSIVFSKPVRVSSWMVRLRRRGRNFSRSKLPLPRRGVSEEVLLGIC